MVRRIEYDVRANWKLIVQNYNECLHCPIIHPLLNRMHHYLGARQRAHHRRVLRRRDGVQGRRRDAQRRRPTAAGACCRASAPTNSALVNYFVVYPNLLLTLHPDYMVTVTIWPQAPDRTRLVCEWHFHPDEIARPGFVYEDAVEFWDVTNREDWAISERSQQGISSRGYTPGPYSPREPSCGNSTAGSCARVDRARRDDSGSSSSRKPIGIELRPPVLQEQLPRM